MRLSKEQRRVLEVADLPFINKFTVWATHRRTVKALENRGYLMEWYDGSYSITDAGRAALARDAGGDR